MFEHTECSFNIHTKLAPSIPEGLRVEVGGVHTVRGRIDAGQLPLVELNEG